MFAPSLVFAYWMRGSAKRIEISGELGHAAFVKFRKFALDVHTPEVVSREIGENDL
jgi:hypothetical protein